MKIETYNFGKLHCHCCTNPDSDRVAYILYPLDRLKNWIEPASKEFGTSIVVVTGLDWDNDLTPWPAPGVPEGDHDFKGLAQELFNKLVQEVIPALETSMNLRTDVERSLVGISLSGLFALWQWGRSDVFHNIATLSGSYWYEGFVEWVSQQSFSGKTGKCYMLLGEDEPRQKNAVFARVGDCTDAIATHLQRQRVESTYEIVPGNHFQYPIERLNKAFAYLER
ncbi:alpha/beta hydrolase-fold protein [Bacteroides thetaiotaomicron]|nr:alpha/beta hydrolase-fold protein [Bacteroides thetaiotaomicron]